MSEATTRISIDRIDRARLGATAAHDGLRALEVLIADQGEAVNCSANDLAMLIRCIRTTAADARE